MDRRAFLKWSGLGSLGLGIGSVAYRVGMWWDQSAADGYEVLSESEAEITRAIADAMFPGEAAARDGFPNGVEASVVEGFDDYLGTISPSASRLLRLVLHAVDDAAIVSDLRFRRFRFRPRDERISILKNWDNSRIVYRRKAFRGLKIVLSGVYCSHSDVLDAAGVRHRCGAPT